MFVIKLYYLRPGMGGNYNIVVWVWKKGFNKELDNCIAFINICIVFNKKYKSKSN